MSVAPETIASMLAGSTGGGMFSGIMPSLIDFGADLFGTSSSNKANKKIMREQQFYQKQAAKQAWDWQWMLTQDAHTWNRQLQQDQFGFQNNMFQQEANFNNQMWDKTSAFNAAESAKQRDWQERMRATQYTTAVGDMMRAGLNPMLAYSQGGAGVPSASAASVHGMSAPGMSGAGASAGGGGSAPQAGGVPSPTMHFPRGGGASRAYEIARLVQEVNNMRKSGDLIGAQTAQMNAQTEYTEAQTLHSTASAGQIKEQTKAVQHQINKLIAETKSAEQNARTQAALAILYDADTRVKTGSVGLIEAQKAVQQAEATLRGLQIPKAQVEARPYTEPYMKEYGGYLPRTLELPSALIDRTLQDLHHSAKGLWNRYITPQKPRGYSK